MPDDNERLNLLIGLHRNVEAEKAAREIIGRNPDWAPAYTQLARALINLNREDEAIEAAREGVRKAPRDAWAMAILACALNWFNRPKEALPSAREAVRLDPTYAWGHVMLASVLYNMNRFEEALQATVEGLKHDPDSASLIRWRGWAEHGLKEYSAALATAEAGVATHPNSAVLQNLLGVVKWALAEEARFRRRIQLHREADVALAEAVRLNPSQAAFRRNLRDNAVSCRRYALRFLVPITALISVLPVGLFTIVMLQFVADDTPFLPLIAVAVTMAILSTSEASPATALWTPLKRFRLPSAPLERREIWTARGEVGAWLLFLAFPYAAVAWVIAKHNS